MFGFLKTRPQPAPPSTQPASVEVAAVAAAAPLRGYKVCSTDRSRKYGVAANSLSMLRTKASLKLKISDPRVYVAKDGTEVSDEDYFGTLPPQTLLVIASQEEVVATDVELIYASIRSHFAIDAGRLVQDFVNENHHRFVEMLNARAAADGDVGRDAEAERLVLCSLRAEHAEWFTGHPPSMDTKEKVMRRRSQDRIRGYYYKTKDELLRSPIYKHNRAARTIIRRTLDVFAHLLTEADHFGQLFNRAWPERHPSVPQDHHHNDDDDDSVDGASTATPKKRRRIAVQAVCEDSDLLDRLLVALCDERGQFRCQGVWNETTCAYGSAEHSINPYASREQAVLFQIWNLDHGVEITRSIIPDLLRTIEALAGGETSKAGVMCRQHGRRGEEVAMLRYFRELFTVDNLRLVHIVCHDKGVHGGRKSDGGVLCNRCSEFVAVRRLCEAVATA